MKLFTVTGTYGSNHTPTDVFCATDRKGLTWYVCEGSVNVNATYEELTDGVNVEELADVDIITAPKPITTDQELEDLLRDEE